jgi:hypothetical protein
MLEAVMIGVTGYIVLTMVMISRRRSRMGPYTYASAERNREPAARDLFYSHCIG